MGYVTTPQRALQLLDASELAGGHPCTNHIGLSNDALMHRMFATAGTKIPGTNMRVAYISTFNSRKDAGNAAYQTLKNLGSAEFNKFVGERTSQVVFADVLTEELFQVRFAFGGGGPRVFATNHMTIVLFHLPSEQHKGFYVRTFYPLPPDELLPVPRPKGP